MSIELKSGQNVTCVMYTGGLKFEAEAIYNYLKREQASKEPTPLKGTDFNIRIENVVLIEDNNQYRDYIRYIVEVRGELV